MKIASFLYHPNLLADFASFRLLWLGFRSLAVKGVYQLGKINLGESCHNLPSPVKPLLLSATHSRILFFFFKYQYIVFVLCQALF